MLLRIKIRARLYSSNEYMEVLSLQNSHWIVSRFVRWKSVFSKEKKNAMTNPNIFGMRMCLQFTSFCLEWNLCWATEFAMSFTNFRYVIHSVCASSSKLISHSLSKPCLFGKMCIKLKHRFISRFFHQFILCSENNREINVSAREWRTKIWKEKSYAKMDIAYVIW